MKMTLRSRTISFLLLVAAIEATGSAIAAPLLRTTVGSRFFGPAAVWTGGSTTVPVFHPLSPPIASAGLLYARFAVQMTQDSGDCQLRVAVRYSNDGVAWDASKDVGGAYVTTDAPQFGTTYVDLMGLAGTSPRAWIQYGVEAENRSGATVALCSSHPETQQPSFAQ